MTISHQGIFPQRVVQMTSKVLGHYKGSAITTAWSFFFPVCVLTVFPFVFSVVFKSRWSKADEESKTPFALVLFVILIVHGLFARDTWFQQTRKGFADAL
jgi:lipopolysaccharide transport system permease protein